MMNWDEKISQFINYLKFEKNFSDNTLEAYQRDIKKLRDFSIESLDNLGPDEIAHEHLQEFLYKLSKEKFSASEREVFLLLIKGYTYREIAERLNISPS